MTRKEIIIPPNVVESRKKWGYSQAIKVGHTIYLAGQVAWDEDGNFVGVGDFPRQAAQCYRNIKRTLEAAGSCLEDIVWMTFLNKDVRLWPQQYPVWKNYFGTTGSRRHMPPGTCIQVANLYDPELLLEVQAIAVVDES